MQTTFSSTSYGSSISIDFIVPQGWHELSDKQLRFVYNLLANEYASDKINMLYNIFAEEKNNSAAVLRSARRGEAVTRLSALGLFLLANY